MDSLFEGTWSARLAQQALGTLFWTVIQWLQLGNKLISEYESTLLVRDQNTFPHSKITFRYCVLWISIVETPVFLGTSRLCGPVTLKIILITNSQWQKCVQTQSTSNRQKENVEVARRWVYLGSFPWGNDKCLRGRSGRKATIKEEKQSENPSFAPNQHKTFIQELF